jgi:hypothetical protein
MYRLQIKWEITTTTKYLRALPLEMRMNLKAVSPKENRAVYLFMCIKWKLLTAPERVQV